MSKKILAAVAVAAAVTTAPLLMTPIASADSLNCDATDSTVTVCGGDGSAEIVATPPAVDGGSQNGMYGPAGDVPPTGGHGLS